MAAHTVDIDVIDKSALPEDHSNIPVINQPNPCYGYSATAKEVYYLMHFAQYCIYESGTNNIINGNTYLDYFPEEGGGGGGGGMTPEEVRSIVSSMTDSEVSDVSTNPIRNSVIKGYVDSTKVTVDSAIDENSTNAIQNGVIAKYVNSSIETATATFRGTYNTKEALDVVSGDKNDYAFLVTTDVAGNTLYNRYKFVEAESSLPEGYTPLLYISNGNTHPIIDTGIVPNIHTGFYIKFNPGDPDRWGQSYFGASSDSTNFGTVDWKYWENNDHYQCFDIFRSGAVLTNTSHNSINEIVYSYPYITANNGTQQQVSPDDAIFTKDITIALFGFQYMNIGNYYDGVDNVKLYSFKLFDGSGNALRDFVPCKNDQNEVGLYDKVSETFFGNVKDSGVFIAGPNDTGHWEFEYSLNNSSFAITVLWDYTTDNSGTIPYEPFIGTLHDNINNYDAIQLEMVSDSEDLDTSGWDSTMFSPITPIYAINNSLKNNYFNHTSFGERSSQWYIKDTTIQKTTTNKSDTNGLVRVYGIKF